MAADPDRPLGPGSAFEAMEGFKLVLLGCTFQEGASYVHHLEACIGVPYRHWITFPRQVKRPNGQVEQRLVHYYSKTADAPATNDLSPVERAVEEARVGSFVSVPNSRRRSCAVNVELLEETVRSVLRNDPYGLVTPPSRVA